MQGTCSYLGIITNNKIPNQNMPCPIHVLHEKNVGADILYLYILIVGSLKLGNINNETSRFY